MFEYISGKIITKNPAHVVIDISGIGYHVKISLNTYEKLSNLQECKLFIHLSIKEDAHLLYGFYSEDERQIFRDLISVSGIGANTAILVLSSLKTSELKSAIITGNVSLLKAIKGIGPKTAQRMIIELQDTLKKGGAEIITNLNFNNSGSEEAISALVMLGFKKAEAEKIVSRVLQGKSEKLSVEEIVKLALKGL